MENVIRLVGPANTVEVLGIRLVGISGEAGKKLLVSLALIVLTWLMGWLLGLVVRLIRGGKEKDLIAFWVRQSIRLSLAAVLLVGILSIWFDDPVRLATGLGLISAGLAFALQKVVSAVAGYLVILRGKMFNIGDRIRMGGVRGDVIELDFIKTTIMEMGQPPPVQTEEPAMWVQSRQYTGRIVTVSNATIFDEPVYNYSRDFPYVWEEMQIPIPFDSDRDRAEAILLEVATQHTTPISELGEEVLKELERRYILKPAGLAPRVYYRLTDNWLELTVRFVANDHGVRDLKDAMSRDILGKMQQAGIEIASGTYAVVQMPTLRVETVPGS